MKISLLFVIVCSSLCAYAEVSLPQVAARLSDASQWQGSVRYEVILPNASEPVTYSLDLYSQTALGDSLSPSDYLIESSFSTPGSDNVSKGFSSYFGGNYYRYRNGKFQEYHADDDILPFAPRGRSADGVQKKDQFAGLLPVFLASTIESITSDSAYHFVVEQYGDEVVIKGKESRSGYDSSEFTYRFDSASSMPRYIEIVTNPGQLGEQIITAKYSKLDNSLPSLDEELLKNRYADVFAKYRKDSFALENLRDEPLPEFSAQTLNSDRYTHHRGDKFSEPTAIAVLDSKVGDPVGVLSEIKAGMSSIPFSGNLVVAFADNDLDAISEICENADIKDFVLVSSRQLVANCGVTDFPTIIFCKPDGSVSDIQVGHNKNLGEIVIQKIAMAR